MRPPGEDNKPFIMVAVIVGIVFTVVLGLSGLELYLEKTNPGAPLEGEQNTRKI